MTDDLVKRIKDRGDWLVDAVATSTQNRLFLRGDPECDVVACDAIRMNGEKAMSQITKPLADRIKELEEKLAKAVSRLDKLTYWLDIDQELWDAFTVMEKSDHRHMQSEVQAIKDILTGGNDD